jgi:2-dehydro-3-deoxyphosphogluconate aldolase/(4S)-4-hydroxy-2-oxoglutarate aldolase
MVEPAVDVPKPAGGQAGAYGIDPVLDRAPTIPVLVVENRERAVPAARALLDGGLGVIEVALGTEAALEALRDIAKAVPEAAVGAGRIHRPRDIADAKAAGAGFLTSPGSSDELVGAAIDAGVPYLPGAATPSEILRLMDRGFERMMLYPAEPLGGAAALAELAGAFPDVRFCPRGGIDASGMTAYLSLPAVPCIFGDWVVDEDDMLEGAWDRVTEKARKAAAFARAG